MHLMSDVFKHFHTYEDHILTSSLTWRSQPLHTSSGYIFPSRVKRTHWAGWDRLAESERKTWCERRIRQEENKGEIQAGLWVLCVPRGRGDQGERGLYTSIIFKKAALVYGPILLYLKPLAWRGNLDRRSGLQQDNTHMGNWGGGNCGGMGTAGGGGAVETV